MGKTVKFQVVFSKATLASPSLCLFKEGANNAARTSREGAILPWGEAAVAPFHAALHTSVTLMLLCPARQ